MSAPELTTAVAGRWPRDVLLVSGADAIKFLQGQVSADVVTLEPGQSTLALLLEPSGKTTALLRLWRTDENVVLIDTDAGAGETVITRLNRFLLRTDATIEALDWECVAIRGPGSAEVDTDSSGAELIGLGMWPGVDGIDLLGPSVTPPEVPGADDGLLEALRIRSGWPVYGSEIDTSVIPASIGSWLITAAVSFTKGCYVGQELTARMNSRGGNVPRRLRTLEIPGSTASVGDDIIAVGDADGESVGGLTSTAVDPRTQTTVALGFVKRRVDDDAELTVRTAAY